MEIRLENERFFNRLICACALKYGRLARMEDYS